MISIVVAEQEPRGFGILEEFAAQAEALGGEVLLATSREEDSLPIANVRRIQARSDSLVPELWRDGLREAKNPFVALTTATMRPRANWLKALMDAMNETGALAVGGSILPAAGLRPLDSALYLARYANYANPSTKTWPAGENAIYRREHLMRLERIWSTGFWETEVYRFLSSENIGLERKAVLEYSGGAEWRSTLARRFRHGKRYGSTRGKSRLRALAAPLTPAILGFRTLRVLVGGPSPAGLDLRAFPAWLAVTTAWSIGEGLGLATRSA